MSVHSHNPADAAFESILKDAHCKIKGMLGAGQYGRVYLVDCEAGNGLAAKVMPATTININEWNNIKVLYKNVSEISPYLIKYLYQKELRGHIVILMEYANWRSLSYLINSKKRFPEAMVRIIMYQLISGCNQLHSATIVHRDLKPDNILMHCDKDGHVICKISDLGMSKPLQQDALTTTRCGTILYMAPEVLSSSDAYSFEADVFALGIIMYSLLSGEHPFNANNIINLVKLLELPTKPISNVSSECNDIVMKMLERDPKERISCSDALKHPFFAIFSEGNEKEEGNILLKEDIEAIVNSTADPSSLSASPLPALPELPPLPEELTKEDNNNNNSSSSSSSSSEEEDPDSIPYDPIIPVDGLDPEEKKEKKEEEEEDPLKEVISSLEKELEGKKKLTGKEMWMLQATQKKKLDKACPYFYSESFDSEEAVKVASYLNNVVVTIGEDDVNVGLI